MSIKDPIVDIDTGTSLRGTIVYAANPLRPVYAFLGIPYAEPPINGLRFKPPKQAKLWKGVRDARAFGLACPQNISVTQRDNWPIQINDETSEDSLFLNVWTPTLNTSAHLPVIFWIHGGGYIQGSGQIYQGTALCTFHDVIVVSINYRLSTFGFFTTGDAVAPGNLGFLDQIEALKWTHRHIDKFGGDKYNITISGGSAGAQSVGFLIVSPLARGLFRRAISQSGTVTYPKDVYTYQEITKIIDKKLEKLGFKGSTSQDKLEFLNGMTASEILTKMPLLYGPPVIDGTFLPDSPYNIYKQGNHNKVEYLLGFNSHEGLLATHMIFSQIESNTRLNNINTFRELLRRIVGHNFRYKHDVITNAIMDEYTGHHDFNDVERTEQLICDIYGDMVVIAPTINVALMHSKSAPTYMYRFDHRPSYSKAPEWATADHTDELMLVFGKPHQNDLSQFFTQEEAEISHMMMSYWSNFAATGNPNTVAIRIWPKYSEKSGEYLRISGKPTTLTSYCPSKMNFWNNKVRKLDQPAASHL